MNTHHARSSFCVRFALAACALVATFARASASETPELVLRGLDPVELCAGREVAGVESLTETRSGFVYRFANEANRTRFRERPDDLAVQFAGACTKMGPLSGRGGPERFHVHEGRIYLFASDGCRASFLREPAKFIDRADAPPEGDAEALKRGAELMALAVRGFGGEEALAQTKNVHVRTVTTRAGDESGLRITTDRWMVFPGTYLLDTQWGSGGYAWLLTPRGGFLPAETAPAVQESVRAYMARELYRNPVAIAQAWRRGEARAVALAPVERAGRKCVRVAASVQGATTELTLDAESGRCIETEYRGRAGAGIGRLVRRFDEFRPVGRLVLPFAVAIEVDGVLATDKNEITAVEVDAELPEVRVAEPR